MIRDFFYSVGWFVYENPFLCMATGHAIAYGEHGFSVVVALCMVSITEKMCRHLGKIARGNL